MGTYVEDPMHVPLNARLLHHGAHIMSNVNPAGPAVVVYGDVRGGGAGRPLPAAAQLCAEGGAHTQGAGKSMFMITLPMPQGARAFVCWVQGQGFCPDMRTTCRRVGLC